MECKDGKPVDVKELRVQLEEVCDEIESDVEHIKSKRDIMTDSNQISAKSIAIDKILDIENNLPASGKLNDQQAYAVEYQIDELIKDLAHNQNIDPNTVSRRTLRKLGIDEKTIDEIMELQHIHDQIEAGEPIDIKELKEELNHVVDEIKQDVRHDKAVKAEIKKLDHEVEVKLHGLEKLRSDRDLLPDHGKLTQKQDDQLCEDIEDIIQDLIGNKNIDLSTITIEQLQAMHLDPTTIDEIMRLKHIEDEIKSGKPVDAGVIKKELNEVIDEIKEDADKKVELEAALETKAEIPLKKYDLESLKELRDK